MINMANRQLILYNFVQYDKNCGDEIFTLMCSFIYVCTYIYIYILCVCIYIYIVYIQGVIGGTDETSGGCSLC